MDDTLALWTAFFLPNRKGLLIYNGLLSPVSGHHAPNIRAGVNRACRIRTVTHDYNQ
jgi:hypothetical protein